MWLLYVESILLTLGVVVQIVAIALLCHDRNKRRNKHQIYIISSLGLSELNGTLTIIILHILSRKVSPLIKHMVWFYIHSFVRLTHHSTITLLTIDRFLAFYSNMRYLILWPSERLLKSLKVVYLVSFLSYISIVCLFVLTPIDWHYISNILFSGYFIWGVIYIIQVIATYCYIFIKYKKHKEYIKRYKAQPNNRQHLRLPIPNVLIVTYIIFFSIPDLVIVLFQFGNVFKMELNFRIVATAYKLSWLADPIIYIYNCNLLKKPKTNSHSKNHAMSNNKTSHF